LSAGKVMLGGIHSSAGRILTHLLILITVKMKIKVKPSLSDADSRALLKRV
jgi:hypothetical protein